MRLWSIHPRYLDARGLVALWREALLAQAVLNGRTRGYTHHPQLQRFRETQNPASAMTAYLRDVFDEATRRGFKFDRRKIGQGGEVKRIAVTHGQLRYEWMHLQAKLAKRSPQWLKALGASRQIESHPLFRVVPGIVENWEKMRL